MRLLPREEKFFDYFLQQAKVMCDSARALATGARAGGAEMEQAAIAIAGLEKKGDEIIHETFVRLNQTFITPLDPEDIHVLASHLDDVIDGIEEAAHRIVAYRLDPVPPEVIEVCDTLVTASSEIEKAFLSLSKDKELLAHCVEINRLEDKVEQIVRKAVAALFEVETNPIQLIKLKEVYEVLEKSADNCGDVADVLQEVAVKNS
ncbi:MAG: DUF47 family protein [Bryobacteraceae bacterium]